MFWRRYKLVLLASPLLVLPIWHYSVLADRVHGHIEVAGRVVGHARVETTGLDRFQSIVEYPGPDGRPVRFTSQVQHKPAQPIGMSVPVLLDPATRVEAVVGGYRGHWFSFWVTAALAYGFFAFAFVVNYFTNRPAGRRRGVERKVPRGTSEA